MVYTVPVIALGRCEYKLHQEVRLSFLCKR